MGVAAPWARHQKMALKILIAGCSGDERARLEPLVKAVIGQSRAANGAWHVSLVKVGKKLSATLKGPGLSKMSFVAAEEELRAKILDTLRGAETLSQAPAPVALKATRTRSEEKQDQHTCAGCQEPYVVLYESRAGEAQTAVPVACPRCWHVNQVAVGEWAAMGEEYRSEKV